MVPGFSRGTEKGAQTQAGSPPAPVPLVKRGRRREAHRAQANPLSEYVQVWGGGSNPTSTLSSVRTPAPTPRAPQSSETLVWLSERAPASQASDPLSTGRSTRMRTPARPSSAPLGISRPSSAPLRSAPLPRPTHLGSGRLRSTNAEFRVRAPAARCKASRVGCPSARPSASRSLCLAAALPWAPKASGHRPLVLAGPPQGRGGASSGAWLGGAGRGGRRSGVRGLAGQQAERMLDDSKALGDRVL